MESVDRNNSRVTALQQLSKKFDLALADNALDKPEWLMLCMEGAKPKLCDRINFVKDETRQGHSQEVALARMTFELLVKAYSLKGNHGSELVKYAPSENQRDLSDPREVVKSRTELNLEPLSGGVEWAYFISNPEIPNQEEETKIIEAAAELIGGDLSILAYGGESIDVGLHQSRAMRSFDSCNEIFSRKA